MNSKNLATVNKISEVNDVWELLNLLAFGWEDGKRNRYILAGTGFQFVRDPKSNFGHPFTKKINSDVSILSGNYLMSGFIAHDCYRLFPSMFKTSKADDGYDLESAVHADMKLSQWRKVMALLATANVV